MKLKIKIIKEVLKATKDCLSMPTKNCAISRVCQKLFPECRTGKASIWDKYRSIIIADLPQEAKEFIKKFDQLTPEERVKMQPFEFEIELTKEALDLITIDEITEVLKDSKTLEAV